VAGVRVTPMEDDLARYFCLQLVSAVRFLHAHRTVHRDLKVQP
jgi:serine/threonine protein kinase